MPLKKVLDIAVQIADGLAAAHAAGIAHRDLKPDNIMLTPEGRVKILDFGLAKSISRAAGHADAPRPIAATEPGTIVGTASYMSPEQASGSPEVDGRSDQFSLGLIIQELITGSLPPDGTSFLTSALGIKGDIWLLENFDAKVGLQDRVLRRR